MGENKKSSNESLKWYADNFSLYNEFAKRVCDIIEELLLLNGIKILSVTSRAKSQESFREKVNRMPSIEFKDIQDLAGVRVVAFVKSDLQKIENVLRSNFDFDENRTMDTSVRLEDNKLGYKSKHYVLKLSEDRIKLPEYNKFKNLYAEVQVKTILQHAWAQIGHDSTYKNSSSLPIEISRDFNLLSGLLEIADNEFQRITGEIERYGDEVDKKTNLGDYNIAIDSVSLRKYLEEITAGVEVVQPLFGPEDKYISTIITELNLMGIEKLEDLRKIIPPDLKSKIKLPTNYLGLLRDLMIIHNGDKYFSSAWRNGWVVGENYNFSLLNEYGFNIDSLIEKYSVPDYRKPEALK